MGLFKKIGEAVKKGAKQISLKNVVKIGTPLLSAIPVVGGVAHSVVTNISAAHEAKKQEQAAIKAGNEAQAEYYKQIAEQQSQIAGAQVGQQAGGLLNAFQKGATNELIAVTSKGTKEVVGMVGAEVADESLKSWFTKHINKFLIGLGVLVGGFLIYKKSSGGKKKSNYRR